MFLAILHYLLTTEEVAKHRQAHRDYLDTCYRKKQLIASGPMVPPTGGLILFRVKKREEVEQIIEQDPFFKNGVAEYQVMEFDAVKSDPEFRAMFLDE
ncbi:YciI family protein [Thermoactinomyces sp. CICC 10523]|uniref:YciI family protein n=1 Tax=Thermoactinomyces sp. CICC 10523 TaxID=2767428 RepID=UPI0018DD6ADB|nr:YciI family protein [Thermoactinomyces sp. CICC 10523]MBH8597623.1 GTP cyclohydrolase [Thermoactinomyces sp. CICC 10523]